MKRIITMQDISCFGKCSLTVAMPVISAMGVEASVIPTAVLSTHSMYKGFTFHDLTGEIAPIMKHLEKEGFEFDSIYTGYLGSFEQMALAEKLFDTFGRGKPILVDPCMADNGKLYAGFNEEFAAEMRKLCARADVICPNLTEAAFLLNEPYPGNDYDEAYIRSTLKKLTDMGCRTAVLTGVSLAEGKLGAYAYDAVTDEWYSFYTDKQPENFHGTGDIWASTFFGAYIRGRSFEDAVRIACLYTAECIRLTIAEPHDYRSGVCFEEAIPYLVDLMKQ